MNKRDKILVAGCLLLSFLLAAFVATSTLYAYVGTVNITGPVTVSDNRTDPNATITWTIPEILNGTTDNPVQNGWAMDFDGDNDYVQVTNAASLNITDELTVLFWFNPSEDPQGINQVPFAKGNIGVASDYYVYFRGTTNSIRFGLNDTFAAIAMPANMEDNWHLLVGTFDKNAGGNEVNVYLNTTLGTPAVKTSPTSQSPQDIYVGVSGGLLFDYNGSIGELLIFNRTLGTGEINYYYENKVPLSQTGLVMWHDYDWTPDDQTPNGNDGTRNGNTQYVRGIRGKADMVFDGTGDFLSFGASDTLETAFNGSEQVIEIRLNPISVTGLWADLVRYAGINTHRIESYQSDATRLNYVLYNSTGSIFDVNIPTGTLDLEENNHIICQKNSTHISIWVNGVFINKEAMIGNIQDVNGVMVLMRDSATLRYYNASIDEFRIYTRALKPKEVLDHYHGIYINETGLVIHLDFDGQVIDQSGNGNNGTENGDPEYGDGWAFVPVSTSINGQASLVNSSTGLMSLVQSAPSTPANYTNVNITHPGATQNQTYALFQVDHYLIDLDASYTEIEAGLNALITATGESVLDGHEVDFNDALNVAGVGAMTWTNYTDNFYGQATSATPATTTFDTVTSFLEDTYGITSAEINTTVTITWTTGALEIWQQSLVTGNWVGGVMDIMFADLTLVGGWSLIMAIFSIGVYNYSGPYAVFAIWTLGWGMFSTLVHGAALSIGIIMLVLGLGIALAKLFLDRRTT